MQSRSSVHFKFEVYVWRQLQNSAVHVLELDGKALGMLLLLLMDLLLMDAALRLRQRRRALAGDLALFIVHALYPCSLELVCMEP